MTATTTPGSQVNWQSFWMIRNLPLPQVFKLKWRLQFCCGFPLPTKKYLSPLIVSCVFITVLLPSHVHRWKNVQRTLSGHLTLKSQVPKGLHNLLACHLLPPSVSFSIKIKFPLCGQESDLALVNDSTNNYSLSLSHTHTHTHTYIYITLQ